METIADKKVHFAPLARQVTAIETLLRDGEFRNVTELMRRALDHYLASRGRPPLDEQARQMAVDHRDASAASVVRDRSSECSQDESMWTDEAW